MNVVVNLIYNDDINFNKKDYLNIINYNHLLLFYNGGAALFRITSYESRFRKNYIDLIFSVDTYVQRLFVSIL